MLRSVSLLVLAGYAGVAGASECGSLASLQWLQGEWRAEGAASTWRETWTAIGPKTWEGLGIEASKSVPAKQNVEELRLVEMGGNIFYLAKVTHNEQPIPFRLTECSDGRLVFANPSHDFPRRIEYGLQPDGRLFARIGDGAAREFTLDFARQPAAPAASAVVLAAEDARFATMVAADPVAMRRWLAEDLEYVHSTGVVENREQFMGALQAGKLRYLAVTPLDRKVEFIGPDGAFVQGQARIEAMAGPTPVDFQARYLAVYRLEHGDWRLRAWQSLRLP